MSARLADRGAVVVDADAITRQLQEPGTDVFDEMVGRFGPGIVAADGTLDRQAVADIVFADPEALADLNGIVHPAVGAEIARLLDAHSATDDVVLLDVPLLVESGRSDLAAMVVVDVAPEIAVQRLVAHRGFRPDDARARLAAQVPREERLARADLVIDNSGTLDELEPQIERCWSWIGELRERALRDRADG